MIRVEKEVFPAFLASALVNGDTSGIEDNASDMEWLERVVRYVAPGRVVSMEGEAYISKIFIAGHEFYGEVADYVVFYTEGA